MGSMFAEVPQGWWKIGGRHVFIIGIGDPLDCRSVDTVSISLKRTAPVITLAGETFGRRYFRDFTS